MSQIKKIHRTPAERAALYEKIQRHITESCEREVREHIHELVRRRAQEREAGIEDDDDDEDEEDEEDEE